MEMHHCLPAASSDLGGLALGTGNKYEVTQELGLFPLLLNLVRTIEQFWKIQFREA